ncbi:hypothetical protein OPQ81_005972 [Rhizoctonia solani]|nr:hypothetical protein OPQ81_005972 [Rhizoctonia solani]
MPNYTFPPAPSSEHLELRRPPTSPCQIPEPAPPIAHASAYMDIVNIRQAMGSPPRSGSTSPPNRKGIRLPWDKEPRPQDGIASGLATTIEVAPDIPYPSALVLLVFCFAPWRYHLSFVATPSITLPVQPGLA